jgi:hypothetical protein
MCNYPCAESLDPFAVIYKSFMKAVLHQSLYFYLSPGFLIVSMIYYFQNKTLFLFPPLLSEAAKGEVGFGVFFYIQFINYFLFMKLWGYTLHV